MTYILEYPNSLNSFLSDDRYIECWIDSGDYTDYSDTDMDYGMKETCKMNHCPCDYEYEQCEGDGMCYPKEMYSSAHHSLVPVMTIAVGLVMNSYV